MHRGFITKTRRLLATGGIAALLITTAVVAAPPAANAAGTPQGPKYSYRMVEVSKAATRAKGAQISSQVCAPTGNATTASYTTSTTRTNTFSVTGDLGFSALKSLLSGKISVSGGITQSSTTTEGLTTSVPKGRCMAVFELRDKYWYTLEQRCNYACTTWDKPWVDIGRGQYSKMVGRAYYYTN